MDRSYWQSELQQAEAELDDARRAPRSISALVKFQRATAELADASQRAPVNGGLKGTSAPKRSFRRSRS
jgi:hypothetical protein